MISTSKWKAMRTMKATMAMTEAIVTEAMPPAVLFPTTKAKAMRLRAIMASVRAIILSSFHVLIAFIYKFAVIFFWL